MPIDSMGQYIREEGNDVPDSASTVSVENGVIIQKEVSVDKANTNNAKEISEDARKKVLAMLKAGK